MPSRAEIRGSIELMLRVLSLSMLAWMMWLSLDRGRPERTVSARSANLAVALRDWSVAGAAPDRAAIQLDSTPSAVERDWMRALAHSGSSIAWRGTLPPSAVAVHPVASPGGGLTVLVAAPSANRVSIEDELGLIEGATATVGGARFNVPSASGNILAKVGSTRARAAPADSIRLGRVLVLGSAGWESKFVTSALEEAGWEVDVEIRVAPSVDVTQGFASAIDTSRYSAVVALDGSAASRAAEIARYASSGGGVILAGATGSLDAFASLRAGATGRANVPPVLDSEPGAVTRASLSLLPIPSLRSDAIRLDTRRGVTAAAARRHGSGRVLQQGYLDTWRWRMSGGDNSPAAHREWWTRLISSVAYAPTVRPAAEIADNAPSARLIDALGEPSQPTASLATTAGSISLWLLFAILSLSLLAEWASRRLRGSR
jgi:hypothetical protein